jgi:adenylate cyclase
MADIFISYSSKDREQAEQLTELLGSAGLSVWIDKYGIGAATSWTKEIVDAINNCKALVLLLSEDSVVSHNVIKEVSLASEKRKKIVPLDLEPVTIPPELEYQLAGIQRTSMTNINAIIAALGKIGLEATQEPVAPRITHDLKDTRKSLIIMPFDDLSPTADNGWFADGLAGELIDTLGKIKSLRILDRKSSLNLRGVQQTTVEIGKLFNTRYFIQGSVRKFGDQIKISVSLLDIETSDHLWQESYKGVMDDIFDLQESVAVQVVEGLKLHLTKEDTELLRKRGTDNSDAYELYMKANAYFSRQTKANIESAIELLDQALTLDPNYVKAYALKALMLAGLHRVYNRDPKLLDEAERMCQAALRINNDRIEVYGSLISIEINRGNHAQAERLAKEWVERSPSDTGAHSVLGFVYVEARENEKAVAPFEESARLQPDNFNTMANLLIALGQIGDNQKLVYWAKSWLPYIERSILLHPLDENTRVEKAWLLHSIGKDAEALAYARELADPSSRTRIMDGRLHFNLASLMAELGQIEESIPVFIASIELGFRHIGHLRSFIDHEASLVGNPEHEKAKRMVEEIEREAEAKKLTTTN